MALTEIFRSANLRKRLSTKKGNSSVTKIFDIPEKQKKNQKKKGQVY